MNVDELLFWPRHVKQRIAAGGHLIHATADDNDQIRFFDALREFWIDADADIAGVIGMRVVK